MEKYYKVDIWYNNGTEEEFELFMTDEFVKNIDINAPIEFLVLKCPDEDELICIKLREVKSMMIYESTEDEEKENV